MAAAAAALRTLCLAVQGINDTMIALVSTVCAFAAGLVISGLGWIVLAMISIVIVLVALIARALDRAVPASLET